MLKKITLQNFKLFKEETTIPLSNINLFTGINGRGKSTVLQSFLLMKQSPEFNRTTEKLIFNGNYVQLGNISDVKNIENSLDAPILFGFKYVFEDCSFYIKYKFKTIEDDSLDTYVETIEVKDTSGIKSDFIIKLIEDKIIVEKEGKEVVFPSLFNLFLKVDETDIKKVENKLNLSKIHYVSADRIGPKLYYAKSSLSEFASVGSLGENTINVLWHNRASKVFDNLCLDGDIPKVVFDQADYWMDKIFDGAKIKLDEIKGTDLLSFRYNTGNSKNYCLPTNVGFGYSYVFPIVISGLIAKEEDILIVENPEAHLHPYAQSILAKLLALVSKNGVQVLIESHSEHILNGLRVSAYDEIISKKELNILYFDEKADNYFVKVEIDKKGRIDNWPKNFFDQATNDLNYLFGI